MDLYLRSIAALAADAVTVTAALASVAVDALDHTASVLTGWSRR